MAWLRLQRRHSGGAITAGPSTSSGRRWSGGVARQAAPAVALRPLRPEASAMAGPAPRALGRRSSVGPRWLACEVGWAVAHGGEMCRLTMVSITTDSATTTMKSRVVGAALSSGWAITRKASSRAAMARPKASADRCTAANLPRTNGQCEPHRSRFSDSGGAATSR